MADVFIKFEREGVEGIVPVGTSLISAARRFGIRFDDCSTQNRSHACALIVSSGVDLLSPLTTAETEHFAANPRKSNERLACEAIIIKPGEIFIMTYESNVEPKVANTQNERVTEDFNSLPLDKKFASLLQMEVTTINEAVKYVADSSIKVLEKVGEAISDIGTKVVAESKQSKSPGDAANTQKTPQAEVTPPGTARGKRPPAPKRQ